MKKKSFYKKSKKVEKVEKFEKVEEDKSKVKEIGNYDGFIIYEKNEENEKRKEKKEVRIETIKDLPKIEEEKEKKEKNEFFSNSTPTPNEDYKNFLIILSNPYKKKSCFSDFLETLRIDKIKDKTETSKVENEKSKHDFIPNIDSLKTSDTFTSISTKNDTFSKCDSLFKNDSFSIYDSLSLSSSNKIINQSINENSTSKILEEGSNSNALLIGNSNLLGNNSLTDSSNKKPEEIGVDMNLIIDKVISCEDLRTTIMIKNIPNKFNRELLLEIIDQHFKGTYDTFVLPTDVNKYKNFGYSFINFTSSYYIPYFYYIFNKKKWAGTNSKKVCELTYSKVQGKNDLSQHYPSKIIYDNKESKMVTPEQKYIIPNAFKIIFNKCFPKQPIEEFKYYFITKMPKNE